MNASTARMLNKICTYLFLTLLSIVIIYPLLITASSAFRVGEEVAREALRLASHKLPIKTKFVKREEIGGESNES